MNQKNFRLSESLQVLRLTPVYFASDAFEINLDQFLFVIESLQYNTTLREFEIGIRHGNMKKKIFNSQLYERERKTCTKKLSNALVKVFAHNKSLKKLTVQYKHANFDECIKIAHHMISSRKQGFNNIDEMNGFRFVDYQTQDRPLRLKDICVGNSEREQFD